MLLRTCLLVFGFLVACGSKAAPIANQSSRPPAPVEVSVEEVAVKFARAALAGDRATALSLTLSYDEATKIMKEVEKETWDSKLGDLLDSLAREGTEGKGEITSATITERKTLTVAENEKLARDVEIAVMQLHVREADGREHPSPMPW